MPTCVRYLPTRRGRTRRVTKYAHIGPLGTIGDIRTRSMRPAARGLAAPRRGDGVCNNLGALVSFGANTSSVAFGDTFPSRGRLWCGAGGRMWDSEPTGATQADDIRINVMFVFHVKDMKNTTIIHYESFIHQYSLKTAEPRLRLRLGLSKNNAHAAGIGQQGSSRGQGPPRIGSASVRKSRDNGFFGLRILPCGKIRARKRSQKSP